MDSITDILVRAGYFRAKISTLSDFDKIIGAIAWAIQAFNYGIEINVYYADSMDLGQKIALTERLVMVLIVMKCPHVIEPHQIVGLDYDNLLPVLEWLIKRSAEKRRQLDNLSRLLALRHFHKVTGTSIHQDDSKPIVQAAADLIEKDPSLGTAPILATRIAEIMAKNEQVSRDDIAQKLYGYPVKATHREPRAGSGIDTSKDRSSFDDSKSSSKIPIEERQCVTKCIDHSRHMSVETPQVESASPIAGEAPDVHKDLDTELMATNQKILEILKKLDCMPRDLEISQYQRRYIELHQELVSKNKDIKKLYALFNTLSASKECLLKEINLLDSVQLNLDCIRSSSRKRADFLRQFRDIVIKIKAARNEAMDKLATIRFNYNCLQAEYKSLLD